ncbi:MAG TPA: hypothetical protein VE981_00395 [Planctomycetota bacterium]|nr:hypothetical protein [Planctomycetota bacterium]
MDAAARARIRFVGWVNGVYGASFPIRVIFTTTSALSVFSLSYAGPEFAAMLLSGLGLAVLTGLSGWRLVKGKPRARSLTRLAGGLSLGYSALGVFMVLQFAALRNGAVTMIRNGSENWLSWSISRFQTPMVVDAALIVWWIIALSIVLGEQEDAGSVPLGEDLLVTIVWIGAGAFGRFVQSLFDGLLSSQR